MSAAGTSRQPRSAEGGAGGRRSYGSGRVYVRKGSVRKGSAGRETFYGSWWAYGRRVNRRLGVKRARGSREGLTTAQAEAQLRRLMGEVSPMAAQGDRLDVGEVGRRYRHHLEILGRKRSTLAGVEMVLRVWIEPHLSGRALERVRPEDIEDMMRAMVAAGVGPKSIRNYIGTLSALYRYAMHPRRRWATSNPCDMIDLPPLAVSEQICFLTTHEVDALASAAVSGEYQALDRALYVTAAMTGLRQGELIALRWQDVDWAARRIRVRRNHVLGEFDTPKSRRSVRSVPMSRRVADELGEWKKVARWSAQDGLVFAEPVSGEVLRRGALMRRYRRALKAAQLAPTHRFHDLRHYADGGVMRPAGLFGLVGALPVVILSA